MRLISRLGHTNKLVVNKVKVESLEDIEQLYKMVVIDRKAYLERKDGQQAQLVDNGCILVECYNYRQELIDWAQGHSGIFPPSGSYIKASI